MGRSRIIKRKNPPSKKNRPSSPAVAPGGPPIQVTRSTDGDRETDEFSEKRLISCNIGDRSFSLELSQEGIMNRVFAVDLKMEEKVEGKASAKLMVGVIPHQTNGASCYMKSQFGGAVELMKGKVYCPPIPDTEFVMYGFTDTNTGSYFSLEKKTNSEVVEMITATHCFSIGEEAFYHVAIRIMPSRGAGFRVEVDGPVKRSEDFVEQLFLKVSEKAERAVTEQFVNGIFCGASGEKDMRRLVQASGGYYVNAGMQSQMGMVNSSGFQEGVGNGSFFNNCRILPRR